MGKKTKRIIRHAVQWEALTWISFPPVYWWHPTRRVALSVRPSSQRRDWLPHADLRKAFPHFAGNAARGWRSRWRGRGHTRGKGKLDSFLFELLHGRWDDLWVWVASWTIVVSLDYNETQFIFAHPSPAHHHFRKLSNDNRSLLAEAHEPRSITFESWKQ